MSLLIKVIDTDKDFRMPVIFLIVSKYNVKRARMFTLVCLASPVYTESYMRNQNTIKSLLGEHKPKKKKKLFNFKCAVV